MERGHDLIRVYFEIHFLVTSPDEKVPHEREGGQDQSHPLRQEH